MKKIAIIAFILFVSALCSGIAPLFAADEKLKVYYSEPIGAGQKVFHVTACQKMRAYSEIKCDAEIRAARTFGTQCDEEKDEGKPIKGCVQPDGEGGYLKIPGTTYYDVNTNKYTQPGPTGCSDKPESHGFKYGPLWVFVAAGRGTAADNFSLASKTGEKVTIEDRAPTPPQPPTPAEGESPQPQQEAKPVYKTGLCATWDVILNNNAAPTGERDLSPASQAIIDKIRGEESRVDLIASAQPAIDAGCNNTLHASSLDSDPSVTCSYVERITGDTGTDILGQYISAIYKWTAGIVGIVAMLTIVYSGIRISVAGGNASAVEEARNNILKALAALAILFLSGLILYTINPTFFIRG